MDKFIGNSFKNREDFRNYLLKFVILLLLSVGLIYLLLNYNNPVSINSPSYGRIVKRRLDAVITMAIAAVCQVLSTITFQTISNNRIITPSLLGFESVYEAIHTFLIFVFGIKSFLAFTSIRAFLIQIVLMVVLCFLLYGFMLRGKRANFHYMLLVGIVIGTGLRSLSLFIRKLLSPAEFDILQARLFASVNNSDSSYFKLAFPIVFIVSLILFFNSKYLNVLSLGKDVSINLGLDYNKLSILSLVIVSILMAISTALVGPMTFFGFLAASLTYEICKSYDHKFIFAMGILLAFSVLTFAYFIMNHVFPAQGVVNIIIEFFGGILFLIMLLRKELV